MPVPHPLLVDIVAKVTGERFSTVNNTARRLRETGLWPNGGFGNASFQREVTVEEAAYLLIGLYSGSGPTGSANYVNEFKKLSTEVDRTHTAIDCVKMFLGEFERPALDINLVFYVDQTPLLFEVRILAETEELSTFLSERKIEVMHMYNSRYFTDPSSKSTHKGATKTIVVPHAMLYEIAVQAHLHEEKGRPPRR